MDEFTIDANFESTAAGRNQLYPVDSRHVANFGRQTDGTRFVVSDRAIFDRNIGLHIRAPSVSPYQAVEAAASRPYSDLITNNIFSAFCQTPSRIYKTARPMTSHGILAYLVGLAGLPHIIAGNVKTSISFRPMHSLFGDCITGYLFPTPIGGVALVAAGAAARLEGFGPQPSDPKFYWIGFCAVAHDCAKSALIYKLSDRPVTLGEPRRIIRS